MAITAVIGLVAARTYLENYVHRFTGIAVSNVADVSSGRSDIWGRALVAMMHSPVSFITGFGWDVWSVMGFYLVAHNHYLSLWFELGLVGTVAFVVIFHQLVTTLLTTAAIAAAPDRQLIVAFVFSFLNLIVGIFFVLLYKPWAYLWAYIGLAMSYTINVRAASRTNATPQPAGNASPTVGAAARSAQTK